MSGAGEEWNNRVIITCLMFLLEMQKLNRMPFIQTTPLVSRLPHKGNTLA